MSASKLDDDYANQSDSERTVDPYETYESKVVRVVALAAPCIVCSYLTMGQELINLIFIGHYGDEAMVAGVGMANMIINIMGLSTMFGLNSALETLVSHSVGCRKYALCGIYLNRSRFIILAFSVPVVIMLLHAEPILIALKQDKKVAA